MISPNRYRRSSHGTYKERLTVGFLCGSPEVPCSLGKLHTAVELWGHGAMAPGSVCPASREVTGPGPAEARWQSEGEQGRGPCLRGSHVCPQISPCPSMDTASHTLNPHHPVFIQINIDHVCEARWKQDSPKGETSSLLVAPSVSGQALSFRWKVIKKKPNTPPKHRSMSQSRHSSQPGAEHLLSTQLGCTEDYAPSPARVCRQLPRGGGEELLARLFPQEKAFVQQTDEFFEKGCLTVCIVLSYDHFVSPLPWGWPPSNCTGR